jgi:HemY protein
MKSLIGLVLLALLAVLSAMLLKESVGTVVFLVPPTRVDLSVGFFILVVLIALWLTFWLGRVLQRLTAFPERVRIYRERRTELGAHRALGRHGGADRGARRAPVAGIRAARPLAGAGRIG